MVLTTAMIGAAAAFIVNEIKNSKGGEKASDEISTGIWNWVRPLFIKDDKKLVEDIEKEPEAMLSVLEYKLKRLGEENPELDNKLAEIIKNLQENDTNAGTIIIQNHSGTGDNIGRDKN